MNRTHAGSTEFSRQKACPCPFLESGRRECFTVRLATWLVAQHAGFEGLHKVDSKLIVGAYVTVGN